MKKFFILLSVFYILFALRSLATAEEKKVYSCHRLVKEPILDGKVRNDPAWKNVPEATNFIKLRTTSLASKQTSFRMGYSGEGIYIGVECEEPEIKKMKAKFKDMGRLWEEDSIEIFIFPKGAKNFYQFIVSSIGSCWNAIGSGGAPQPLWDWEAKTYKGKDYWSAEIRIPFELFLVIPEEDDIWTGNICRNISTSGDRTSSWAQMEAHFHEPGNFAKLIFKNALLPEEVAKIERNLIKIYLRKEVKRTEKLISNWEKENPLFFKEKIRVYLIKWEKTKKELSRLGSLPPHEIHRLWRAVREFANLPSCLDKLREEFLRNSLFSEEI